ncbi:MAG: diguanylate cyclase [Rhodobacteraceae bacterium]|nr:diguanylate cyclase [Paracoccaceae bacterium]
MAGQILIADDLSLNRTVLRGKLTSACYRTITANGGKSALKLVHDHRPDLVLLDYHMPDMDGLAVCQAMRADPLTRDIPIILFSATADHDHRLAALAAGADDFMAKPLNEAYLLGRIRSLLRKVARRDEWRDHPNTALQAGLADPAAPFVTRPKLALVAEPARASQNWQSAMASIWPEAHVQEISVPAALRLDNPHHAPDLFIITPEALERAGLHIIAELRSRTATRNAEICLVLPRTALADGAMALDLGAADVLPVPLDRDETRLRLERIIRHKRRADAQRRALDNQLGLAAFDALTGLHNRSHGMAQLARLTDGQPAQVALLLIDIDRFKDINDRYGHTAGDQVLRQVAQRMRQDLRHDDILCRYGGEEFLLAMPHADSSAAQLVAERLCLRIAEQPYSIPGKAKSVNVTASIGIALHNASGEKLGRSMLQGMIEAADTALRAAKHTGRNRVITAQTAIA